MNFRFTPEEEAFRAEVRAFIEREATPEVIEVDGVPMVDTPARRAFIRKLSQKGWIGMTWPTRYGGQGLSGRYDYILIDELNRAGAPPPTVNDRVGKTLILFGSEELRAEFLPRLIRGEIQFATGYTEPEAGSDLASLRLRAERDGDFYVLNGQKRFTSAAHFAEYCWLAARTDPDAPKHRGISIFIVDLSLPGITIRPLWTLRGGRTNEVFYEDVRVPARYLVGEENKGWYYISQSLDIERYTAFPFGSLAAMLDAFIDTANSPAVDGRRLADRPTVRRQLGRLAIEVEVAKMLIYRVLAAADRGRIPNVESTMSKLWATQLSQRLANAAVDALGLYGQLGAGSPHAVKEGRWELLHRSMVNMTVGGGSSEVQKNIIARRALGLPG